MFCFETELSEATQMLEEVWETKAAWWVYFALVGLDLLSAEQFPSESLQLLHPVLACLPVGAHNAGTQVIWRKQKKKKNTLNNKNTTPWRAY